MAAVPCRQSGVAKVNEPLTFQSPGSAIVSEIPHTQTCRPSPTIPPILSRIGALCRPAVELLLQLDAGFPDSRGCRYTLNARASRSADLAKATNMKADI